MTDPKWERYAAAAGLGAAALLAIQAAIAPPYPWYEDPLPRTAVYYFANASAIRVQVLLTGIAGVLFLWWLGSLRVHLRRAEGDPGRLSAVAFGSALAAAGTAGAGALATLVATRAGGAGHVFSPVYRDLTQTGQLPGGIELLHELRLGSYALVWFALAPMLAAVAVVSARTTAFPRTHMNATYVLAILSLGTGLSLLIDTGPFAPGGIYGLVLFALFVIWLGATSWLMMRALEPASRAGPPQEAGPEPEPRPDDTQPIV